MVIIDSGDTKMKKICTCPAYNFPHRMDSGKCREMYNEQAPEESEAEQYYAQRGLITSEQRQMHDAGHRDSDF